jgi:hypothetical protein
MRISRFGKMTLVRTDGREICCGTNYSDEQSREVRRQVMELYRGLSDITGDRRGSKVRTLPLRMEITLNSDERCYRVTHWLHGTSTAQTVRPPY